VFSDSVSGVVDAFLLFLNLIKQNIPAADTTRQHIPNTGLTAIHASPIVKNPNVKVKAKEMIHVLNQIIFDRNGNTFASVLINSNIILNPANIRNNPSNLNIHVSVLFAFCACKNIVSALTLPFSSNAIVLSFDVV
jgi:hypothetical protein